MDTFHLNAKQVDENKQKYSVYETAFQAIKLTTTKKTNIDLKTEKTPLILLNFWASWCLPCLQEFPSLIELQKKYPKDLKVIGINGDEENPAENIKKIEAKYKLNFESIMDPASKVSNQFMINSYPVSILFHKGSVIYVSKKQHNFMDSEFIEILETTLKAK